MKKSTLEMLKNFTILVVEDDDVARSVIKQELKGHFSAFFEAKDGLEGLEIFKKHRVDIILSDLHMPNLNGFEMIKQIQQIKPKQDFIAMTSYDSDENLLSSVEHGALNFLRKPLEILEIKTALVVALAKKSSQKVAISKEVSVDFASETIYLGDEAVFLSYKNHKIFWLLCYNLGRLVSYDLIEDWVYFDDEEFSKKAVQTAIIRIKKQLGDLDIENIYSSGYVLKKSV
ncbi:response regulator transcription factor [Campylobacter geochelonis]|uniref:Putative two-component regulator n=1 Tax=Campylobacter geochelonis TaxID=1780362 RepID=A0A128EP10_9BACT|nr:response regulator transcription factor [Campylobacter geochelonis]QKF70382.1 two-component system response regulator [Campylobacter geochelonis]CZE46230.1 putative two-component regulator [Campylobacter geochelonis]CZE46401.1 putative two-component regulator [Campylobacter geochelonis]CZE50732.1 putative two-component regulator [Campylobacter geochelonis]